MPGVAQQLKLRLFIEGVEVPVIAASVQCAPNSPAMCSLQIPPLAEGTRFLPRSLVHLYFLDLYESQSPFASKRGPSQHDQTPSTYQQGLESGDIGSGEAIDADIRNDRYKLLFGGEVVGFGWTKNQAQRSLVLQCQDWSNYWDYAYQFNNTDLFGPGIKAMFSGGSTNLFDDFMTDEGTQIIQLLMSKSVQYPKLEGLLGGIVHLLESIGGSYYYEKQYAGQNMFYSLAELRLHISQMITAFPSDPTAQKLLGAGYDSLFGRTLGNLGAQVSFRQAINALMPAIFHETYAIPTPKYTPGTGNSVNGSKRRALSKHPIWKGITDDAASMRNTLQQILQLLQGDPTVEDLFNSVTITREEISKTLKNVITNLNQLLVLTSPKKELQGLRGYLTGAQASVKQAVALLRTYDPKKKNSGKPLFSPLNSASDQLKRIMEFDIVSASAGKGVPARLNQQIFRPDVWFAAPPRCNVLFPEHYTQLEYQRMFLAEPTRMLLKTNDEFFGEDELFDKFFFAPKVPTVKAQQKQLQAVLGNDLMPHELFTGILPVFEKMGELNIFAARTGWVDGKEPKIGLAQRSVNFLYFKHRFAARSMSVSARFNPYLAPGFPGLIIDKYVDYDNLVRHQQQVKQYAEQTGLSSNVDIDKLLGTHFLGNFTQVSHTVDQRSGRTDIQCGFPRQYDESSEFLGSTEDGQTVMRRKEQVALRATDVAVLNAPKLGSLGPNFGIVRKITEVTDKYQADTATLSPKLPYFAGGRHVGSTQTKLSVPAGLTLLAAEYGEDVVKLIGGDAKQPIRFLAYTVEEEIPRYRKEKIDLGAEELIRPGWYGDCWRPDKIGEVYDHFFSTGAITDKQQVADPGGTTTGAAKDDLADPLNETDRNFADETGLAPAILMLETGATIQQATSFIVQLYSYVKQGGLDTEEFIRGYVWRPIASMVDMFGTTNLTLDTSGHEAIEGIEGFHSRAFGPYEDLFGIVPPEIDDIVGIKRKKTLTGMPGSSFSEASSRADVRKRRQDAVKEYVAALKFSRAILG